MLPIVSLSLLLAAAMPTAWAQGTSPETPSDPNASACSPLHYIFARATTEPPEDVDDATAEEFEEAASQVWSQGYGAAGYSIFTNLTALVPDATGYPVHYPASFGDSMPKGIEDIISHITAKSEECPDQLYALGGHSQGGFVTIQAIPQLPEDILSRIIAVTMVGSPACPAEVEDRCRSYCNAGDFVCDGGGIGGIGGIGGSDGGLLGGLGGRRRSRLLARQEGPDCSGPEPPETGHEAAGDMSAHLAYNEDGFYVYAAACYILGQYEASG